MNFYPLWPYFVSMAALLVLVATSAFAKTDGPAGNTTTRQPCIDGRRGFLAYGVFFGHAALYHQYIIDGGWATVSIPTLYTLMAQCGVALFFMITGYLFWGKLLKDQGRPRWTALYVGRLLRIGPLYLCAIGAMMLLVLIRSGYALHEPAFAVMKEIAHWALLGWDRSSPDVNGFPRTSLLLAGVTWTLTFEWQFYASLLILAFAARKSLRTVLAGVSAGFIVVLLYLSLEDNADHEASRAVCAFLFLCGMLVASIEANGLTARLPKAVLSWLMAAVLVLIYTTCTGAYAPLPALLLCAVFYLVVSGADLFGLLTSAPARRLGNVSFGIYLLHGLVLTVVFSVESVVSFAVVSPYRHWLVVFGCAVLLMCVASVMHVVVELPGIAAGRRMTSWLARKKNPSALPVRRPA